MFTLRKAIRCCDQNEPWTVAAAGGYGWLYYYDGHDLHSGAPIGVSLDDLLDRKCVQLYERDERTYWSDIGLMELKKGMAFIVDGDENGDI